MALGNPGKRPKNIYRQILDPKTLAGWRMRDTELRLLRKTWDAPVSKRAVGRSDPSACEKPRGAYICSGGRLLEPLSSASGSTKVSSGRKL